MSWIDWFSILRDYWQGRNEVYFFIADPVFWPKYLIPDSKSDENFDSWSRKILLIPGDFLFIASMHYYTKAEILYFTSVSFTKL